MKRIARKTEYFLDIPKEISTTGHSPYRGLYTLIILLSGDRIWFDNKDNEISNKYCVEKLNTFESELINNDTIFDVSLI